MKEREKKIENKMKDKKMKEKTILGLRVIQNT